jgi:hypothetical protein
MADTMPPDWRCEGTPGKPGRFVIRDWLPGVEKSGPCPGCPDCRPESHADALTTLSAPVREAVEATRRAGEIAAHTRAAEGPEVARLVRVTTELGLAAVHLDTALRETGSLPEALRAMAREGAEQPTEGGPDGEQ